MDDSKILIYRKANLAMSARNQYNRLSIEYSIEIRTSFFRTSK